LHKPEHLAHSSDSEGSAVAPVSFRAILLCDGKHSKNEQNLAALFDFFGIPWITVNVRELVHGHTDVHSVYGQRFCVVSSAACMAAAFQGWEAKEGNLPGFISNASSVYLYNFQECSSGRELLHLLTGRPNGDLRRFSETEARLSVTDDFREMCGPLSGLEIRVGLSEQDACFLVESQGSQYRRIISGDFGDVFSSVTCQGVRFFLSASSSIVDIDSPATKYFDVKKHFCPAVPIVLYLLWAFGDLCWTATQTRGCLIVDDPLLRPRYGFLRFSDALELMDRHNFTTSIGFIPWNWHRTNARTMDQFRSRADRLSVCVHGCDHSSGEFAARSSALLNKKAKTAGLRMNQFFSRTSFPPDNIMVFPQGQFSPEAGRVLKLNGFVAAVNTEVAPADPASNDTKIRDLWDIAIMRYGGFPIFTRRYLTHGIENFAFDALLGKPCLLVAHHEIFRGQGRELVEFIDRLNSLMWNLRWCSLGEVLRNSFKSRSGGKARRIFQMYANQMVIEQTSSEHHDVIIQKSESDPNCVREVQVNEKSVDYTYADNQVKFKATLLPGESAEVRVRYSDTLGFAPNEDGLGYRIKIHARRYLSELRDNYLSQSDFLYRTAIRLKSHFH